MQKFVCKFKPKCDLKNLGLKSSIWKCTEFREEVKKLFDINRLSRSFFDKQKV